MLEGIQVRMGRAAVGWSVRELARNAGVTPNTISRIENGGDALASTMERLQTALENGGVIFIDADEEGPGVRLRVNQVGQ
jgi:transcriptional regulator with XRE-family HTH domain